MANISSSSTDDLYNKLFTNVIYNDLDKLHQHSTYINIIGNSTYDDTFTTYTYTYSGQENTLISYIISSNNLHGGISYTYDELYRLSTEELTLESFNISYTYGYQVYGEYTSGRVQQVTTKMDDVTTLIENYTYDADGNIIRINNSKSQNIYYTYDDLGQLVREDNSPLTLTYTYSYDDAGNIVQKNIYQITSSSATPTALLQSIAYTYSSSAWGDLLTSYNGHTITYDNIGNPLSYYNGSSYTFTWDGRRLATAVKGANTMSFTYNNDGLRTTKTLNGVVTTYYYQGSLLIAEETNSQILVYLYDANGSPVGFMYRGVDYASGTWDTYAYEKNLQGDVIGVYDTATGNKLIAYKYNAWGSCTTSYYNSGMNTTATKNPFKYRGYYYDVNLGFYYLQSRYYDPIIGRFISPDYPDVITASPTALTDKNLFAYCDNNPIMRVDEDGELWNYIIGGAVGAVLGGLSAAYSSYQTVGYVDSSVVFIGATTGAIGGVIGASGLPWYVQSLASASLSIVNDIASSRVQGQKINHMDIVCNAMIAATSSAIASSVTYFARSSAEKTIKSGVGRVIRGVDTMKSGSRYWKGAVKRGIEIIRDGVHSLNVAQGQASVIGTAISSIVANAKTFFSNLLRRE